MRTTAAKPATVGGILKEEFLAGFGVSQRSLADAMGVPRKDVNELCNDRRAVTASTALILARVFGNSADFWLNIQRQNDLWNAMNSPQEQERIARAADIDPGLSPTSDETITSASAHRGRARSQCGAQGMMRTSLMPPMPRGLLG